MSKDKKKNGKNAIAAHIDFLVPCKKIRKDRAGTKSLIQT